MPNYRRAFVPGGCWFFTVALLERRNTLLVDHIAILRDAVARTRERFPFEIDAVVVLPDHLHAVWTLPPGDADLSTRWRLIKTRFAKELPKSGAAERGPRLAGRTRHLAAPVLGALDPRRGGLRPARRVLHDQPGEARAG
jgi:REP element-mobilizing transposase RayT